MINERWFKEDRELYTGEELDTQKEETEKAIKNSSLLSRRLKRILEEDIERTLATEENFDDPAWERKTIAAAAERKTLRRVINILP
jgi:hypothetical protein